MIWHAIYLPPPIKNIQQNLEQLSLKFKTLYPVQKLLSSVFIENQFVVDFKESELFNSFFANQCTLIETGSNLLTLTLRRRNESWNTINFTEYDILSV